jgi:hypothetical protein
MLTLIVSLFSLAASLFSLALVLNTSRNVARVARDVHGGYGGYSQLDACDDPDWEPVYFDLIDGPDYVDSSRDDSNYWS